MIFKFIQFKTLKKVIKVIIKIYKKIWKILKINYQLKAKIVN